MLLIWRGWGILVIPIVAVAFFASMFLGVALEPLGLAHNWAYAAGLALGAIVSALSIWFLAKSLSGKVVRRLIDPATGKDVLIRRSAGSLFFIPTSYWAYIVAVLGLLMAADFAFDAKAVEKAEARYAPASAPVEADTAQSQ